MSSTPPRSNLPAVELHIAWSYSCDACGRDNFARAVTVPMASIDPADISEEDEILFDLLGGQGDWHSKPTSVKCGFCGAEFEVNDGEQAND